MRKVLTIAGSDSSGGAGIQADIKTITVHSMYAMSAITALTAQNTTGVYGIMQVEAAFVENQLDCVFTDIFPDAVKIGMVSGSACIASIAQKLQQYQARHVVIDPVMVSTSGAKLLSGDAYDTLLRVLLPLAEVITPNLAEAQVLCGFAINSKEDMAHAARAIAAKTGTAVLVKGGHLEDHVMQDVLCAQDVLTWFYADKVENNNTHGTGCTLSAAIACNLAQGDTLVESVQRAKEYVTGALHAGLDLGHGSGPLAHTYLIPSRQQA